MDEKLEGLVRCGFALPDGDDLEELLSDPWRVDVPLRLCGEFGEPEVYQRFESARFIWEDAPIGNLTYSSYDGHAILDVNRMCAWDDDERLLGWTWWASDPDAVCAEEIGRRDASVAGFYDDLRDEALGLLDQIRRVWDAAWEFEGSTSWMFDENGVEHPSMRFRLGAFKALDTFHVRRSEEVWEGEMQTDEGLPYNRLAGPLRDVLIALRRIARGYLTHDRYVLGEGESPGWNAQTVLFGLECEFD